MSKNVIPSNKNFGNISNLNSSSCWNPYFVASVVWFILILVAVVIYLLTMVLSEKMVNADRLIAGIVNFATLLSIFLSGSSICFALYTSMQTTRQYDSMSQAVTEIKETNNFMKSNNHQLLKNIRDMARDLAYLGGRIDGEFQNRQSDDKNLAVNSKIPNNNPVVKAVKPSQQLPSEPVVEGGSGDITPKSEPLQS